LRLFSHNATLLCPLPSAPQTIKSLAAQCASDGGSDAASDNGDEDVNRGSVAFDLRARLPAGCAVQRGAIGGFALGGAMIPPYVRVRL
jgi:hypothetical protein